MNFVHSLLQLSVKFFCILFNFLSTQLSNPTEQQPRTTHELHQLSQNERFIPCLQQPTVEAMYSLQYGDETNKCI